MLVGAGVGLAGMAVGVSAAMLAAVATPGAGNSVEGALQVGFSWAEEILGNNTNPAAAKTSTTAKAANIIHVLAERREAEALLCINSAGMGLGFSAVKTGQLA